MTASSRLGMDCNRRYDGEVIVGCMLLWDLEYSPYLLDIDVFTYPRLDITSATYRD